MAPKYDHGALFMNRLPVKTFVALTVAAIAALGAFAAPAAAKSKPDCWKVVLNDWYDGRITGKYAIRCYRQALDHLRGGDLGNYTSAYDDINRALQQRLAEIAAAKNKKKQGGVAAATKNGGSNQGSSGPTGPSNPQPPSPTVAPGKQSTSKHPQQSKGPHSPKAASPAPSTHPTSSPGRDPKGATRRLVAALGPKDATSLPMPLIVLAGIGLLLVAVGAATLVAKRAQGRRVPVRVQSTPPAQHSR